MDTWRTYLDFLQICGKGFLWGAVISSGWSFGHQTSKCWAKLGVWVQIYPVHLGHKHQGFRISDLAILIDLRMCVDARSGVQIWAEDIWAYKMKPNNVQIINDCADAFDLFSLKLAKAQLCEIQLSDGQVLTWVRISRRRVTSSRPAPNINHQP